MKEKIIFLTKECGIVTSQIAKQAGIPISSLSKWLNGTRSSLTEENEQKLAQWLEDFKIKIAQI